MKERSVFLVILVHYLIAENSKNSSVLFIAPNFKINCTKIHINCTKIGIFAPKPKLIAHLSKIRDSLLLRRAHSIKKSCRISTASHFILLDYSNTSTNISFTTGSFVINSFSFNQSATSCHDCSV